LSGKLPKTSHADTAAVLLTICYYFIYKIAHSWHAFCKTWLVRVKKRQFKPRETIKYQREAAMTRDRILRIGSYKSITTPEKLQRLRGILDKLEIPYVLDSISFHNTSYAVSRMKTVHETKIWKVEKDGSVSLINRFGHSGRFEYRYLNMPNPLESQFVDTSSLSDEEIDFLSFLLFKANSFSATRTTTGT
jgi:hypothetical protein